MTSKIIDPRPVALPNLSQLPDPMKDLMGGSVLLNPTSMMTMSQRDINDLFNPKPIDGNLIKPSAEAAKVLQTAQQEAASQLELAARRQQQHDEMLARRRKEEEQRIEAYRKRAEEIAKEREKALKEKKEQQGGKLGAAPDGSFLADRFVKNVTSDKGWNDIVSTLERNDVMEAELAKFETALRNSNVADDIIQEELKRARTGISSHTKQYEKEFTKEGLELTDLGVSLGKNATNLAAYATLLSTSIGGGKAISGIVKSVSGRDIQTDTINMLVDARTAIDSKYSGTLKLRRANDQYTMEKAKRAAGGELGWADEASTAIKSMWDNDMGVYYAIEAVPDLIGSAGAGFVGKLLLKGGAKVVGRVVSKELAETTAMKNLAKIVSGTMTTKSKTANLALKGLSVPSLSASGYGVASTMAATATDTYDTIRHTSSEVLSKHYGAENWNALVSEVGEQKAKEILATQAARDAASNIGPVALLTSMFGLEGAVGGLMIKRAAAEVAERTAVSKTRTAANLVGSVTLGAGTEALEEGYTQYSSNVAMNPLTGVNPMEDVARAAASGAYVGGVLNGTIKAADMAGTYRAINSLNNISADKGFTTNADGTVTFDSNAFKSAMGEAFATVNKVHREGHGSFSDGKAATQAYYDRIFDADERYQQYATPEQKADVQKFARENYGVNTNNFTFFDDNETSSAFKSDDIERVRATGNELLLDSYRIKHGVELDQVNPENTQVAKAIARSIDHVNTLDPNLNTFQREHEFQKFIENDLDKDASLDVEDRAAIVQFMGTHYGTRATRMTDEEQAAYDEQVKQYQASQQENTDEPVSQATATDGAGSPRQTGGQPTQEQDTEVGADGQQVPPQSDTQSPRNASTRQTDNASTTEDFSTEPSQTNGGPNAGAAEVQNARDTGNPTSSKTGGGTPTQNGNTGQTNQGGQPFGQTGPSTPQTPNGGRSTGATTAERRADNGSDQTSTEAVANALRDGIRPVTTQELKHANKAIQNILNKAKGLKGKHTYDPKRLELWVTASADGFAELNYGISNKHKTNLDDKRDNNTNLRNTAIVAILAFREKGDKTLQSKTNAEQTTTDTNADNGSQDVDETNVADIVDENPQTVTETVNANEQNQTQTEPRESSPTIDTTTTQDRAGASGLSDDTQTAAKRAEPVKPKRGGRSKKKTTAQLDLFEQNKSNTEVSNLTEKQMNALYSFAKELGLKGSLKKSGKFIPARAEEALSNLRELATTNPQRLETLINLVGLKTRRVGVEYAQILRDLAQLTSQEQTNAEENDLGQSVQPTTERTQDDNEVVRERTSNEPTNDERREILGQSGQPVSEQSQESGTETTQDTDQLGVDTPTYYADNLTAREINAVKEIADNEGVDVETVYQAIADGNIHFFSGRGDSQGASLDVMAKELVGQEVATNMSAAKDLINRLTTPPVTQETQQATPKAKTGRELIQDYLNANPSEYATIRSYFNEQQALAQRAVDENADNLTDEIISNYNLFNGPEIDFIEKMLGDRPFTGENIAQVIADTRTVYTAGITFDSLPTPVQNIIRKIWDKIKSTVAAISMALAITTGTTLSIPTEVNAATPTETAVVQNIISQNDNQGKQFIVADKQAGTLTLYTPQGQEVTSTPALFGKATGDSISTNNATPSGRYDLKHVDGNNIKGNEKGQYGNSAQALVVSGRLQENNAGNVAIHRVLPIESRQAKLDSATATDNRVSHGCINVPSSFYDIHLDRQQDTVVYVMPETNAGRTGVFNTPNVDVEKPTTDKDGYANAKTNTVEMTADEVTKAVNDSSQKVAKATTSQVLTVANTKPTGQIALVHSVVLPKVDVAATRMAVIQGQYTPAEQKANDKFDTEPVKEKYDGVGLSDIAVAIELALVGLAGGVVLTAGRRRRGRSDTDAQTTTEPPVDDTPDETQVETPTNDLPNDIDDNVITDPQDVELDDTMDSQYSEFVAYNNDVLLSEEEEQQELYQALGFETIASEFDKSVAGLQAIAESFLNGAEPGSNKLKSKKTATASGVKQAMKPPRTPPQIAIDRALMIRAMNNDPNIPKTWVTMASMAADILDEQLTNARFNRVQGSETRQWKFVSTKKGSVGALAKLFNVLGGATPLLDTVARNNNIAAVGYEADSNVLSTSLAGIKMRRTGVFSVLSSRYLDPLNKNIHKLAYRAKVEQATLREDLGELANARHILDEAYAYHVKDIKEQIGIAQTAVDTIRSKIASQGGATAEQANDLSILNKHLDELNTEFKLIDDTYNGKIAWDKSKVKLPGGRVKAEWEKIISDTKAKYGENYDSLVALSDDIYNALTETRKYAAAHGVYNTDQLASINNIGFKKYVPLYKKEKTADEALSSHPDDEVQLSIVAKTLNKYSSNYRGFAVSQTRDLTRYHRQGATSPADNAYNNLEAYLLNMAGRIAEQPFREVLQQAYEGTTYTPYSASAITDPETLAELNTPEGSKFSGLIRVPVGGLEYLPNSLKERIKAPNGVEYVKPIRAKGYDKDGNVVDFDYYFTDKAVRDELYSNVDFSLEFDTLAVNALSRLTRFQAGLFTRFNPTWNAWNYVQDSSERISNILFREVRDKDGNRINRIKVAGAYVKSLATMTANPHALFEILQYMHDDTKLETPLQRLLHEAKRSGAISLITSLTKRSTALQELKKSDVERLTEYAKNKFGVIIDSNIITHKGAKIVSASAELYFNTIVELPQILTALAAYEAYRSVGVNQAETANRVRDQFDPFRAQNSFIKKASVMYPFVRAAGAGGYNLLRTLTQYWGKGDRLGTVLTLAAGAAIMYGLQAMALAALGYDDDDEPYAKRLSATDLARGIPLKGSKGDVLFFPVGFGLNALVATITANVHSMQMGQQSGTEAMMNVAGSITHNLSPVNTGSSASWAKDPTAAAILMLSPTIVQPLVEIATNTDAFTSRDIYGSKTPKDERDSEQGGANVPEKYKDYAKSIYKVGLDVRPETIQHLAENYLVGPLKAITADINDRADKTLGAESTKGEYYGTFATAIGLDLKRSHTALSDTNYSYKMLDLQSKILKSYNVPTSHAAEDYAEFDINRKTEGAAALTASKLRAAGASESEISFVLNAMEFSNARENINRDYNKAKVKLVRSQAEGADTSEYINAYEQVQNYSSAVFDLTKTYISENRELYDEMLQKYK